MKMMKPDELPPADTIIDYGELGFGPLFLHWSTEYQDIAHACKEAGFECRLLEMEDDLGPDDQLCIDHFEYGASDTVTRWQPTEQGDGWRLVAKHDAEDGPVALFIRPIPKAP